jgi:hypothetical protein
MHLEKINKYKELGLLKKINDETQKAIYTPRYELIYKKIVTGPKWDEMTGRVRNIFMDNRVNANLTSREIKENTSERKRFSRLIKTPKKPNLYLINSIKKISDKRILNLKQKIMSNKNLKNFTFDKNASNVSTIKVDKNASKFSKMPVVVKPKKITSLTKCRSVPDFNRCIGREEIDKIMDHYKLKQNDTLYPNYNSIEERVKMIMVYNRKSSNMRRN